MARRFLVQLLTLVLLLSALIATPAAAASSAPIPTSMAAVGDSISQAASTGGSLGADYPQNAWSTGTNSTVNSHFLRLRTQSPNLVAHNLSVSGAKVGDLPGQMQNVVGLSPDPGYVTVLIGGNDLCTNTVAAMTSVDSFRSSFTAAMQTVTTGSPGTYVYVVSIPDVYQLWSLFKNSWWARFVWSAGQVCQSLLANPTSTQSADAQRRAQVRQRNIDFNTVLKQVCESQAYASRCKFDNNASFNTKFTTSDVSADYFHPSIAGQAKLASVSWTAGYTWTSSTPSNQAPAASFAWSCNDLTCAFTDTSTDVDGTIAARSWTFGDGGTSTQQNPSRSYATGGTYTVTLTVTDDKGAQASASQSVTVTAPPPPGGLALTVASYKVKGIQHADLSWSGASSTNVDVFRDGSKVTTTANDGAYTDNIGQKGGGSHTYWVCEAGTSNCSDEVTVAY